MTETPRNKAPLRKTHPLLSHAVDHRVRFSLLTVCGRATRVNLASFAFGTRYMRDLPARRFTMPPGEILLVNPNTGTTPLFRSRRDAEITIGIYKRVPVLWREDPAENPWGLSFMAMFHMANDSGLFRTAEELLRDGWNIEGNVFVLGSQRMLPLYEAKMVHHFDHRLGTYEGQSEAQANVGTLPRVTPEQHDQAEFAIMPRYWVSELDVLNKLRAKRWERNWLLGWRRIARSSDERTMISTIVPRSAVGDSEFLMLPSAPTSMCALLAASLSSFVLDYAARQKMAGTNLSYFIVQQLPIPSPDFYSQPGGGWMLSHVLELIYTVPDIASFATELGDDGPPFRWDDNRRFAMRAELDAAFFHLYGIERDDVEYIMETFPVVRKRDEQRYGTFRTKELILETYDAMTEAALTGKPYQTIIDPPPGRGPRHG